MDAIQMMESMRQDEECRATYAECLRLRGVERKARKIRRLLILAVVLPIAIMLAWKIGGMGVLLIVLVFVAFLVSECWSGKIGNQKDSAWSKSGMRIVLSLVQAYFQDSRFSADRKYDECKNILRGIIAADKQIRDHRIAGKWRGTAFTACHAELLEDGGEDADTTLFSGLILEVEAHPDLNASLAARLDAREFTALYDKHIKGETREQNIAETRRVFHREWMETLSSVGGYYPVMACVKSERGKRFVQVGIGALTSVYTEEADVSYDEFIDRVAESLERVQRLLDVILDNQQLF